MRRIDLMTKEEIAKIIDNPFNGCGNCPAKKICDNGDHGCLYSIHDYLFEEVEAITRASLYKTKEEAFEKYFGAGLDKYYESDILDFAEFLMEKVPKPLDKKSKV